MSRDHDCDGEADESWNGFSTLGVLAAQPSLAFRFSHCNKVPSGEMERGSPGGGRGKEKRPKKFNPEKHHVVTISNGPERKRSILQKGRGYVWGIFNDAWL